MGKKERYNKKKVEKNQEQKKGQEGLPKYLPYLNIADFSSMGVIKRVKTWRTGIVLHLFADPNILMSNVALLREYEIKDEYPLRCDLSLINNEKNSNA